MELKLTQNTKIQKILNEVKDREFTGYSYDGADASFELLANKLLGKLPEYLKVKSYNVNVKKDDKLKTTAEVTFIIDGKESLQKVKETDSKRTR